MGQIRELQSQIYEWQRVNFPFDQTRIHRKLIGVMEELGELCHAFLRWELNKPVDYKLKDAIGDIFIFLVALTALFGFDLEEIIIDTFNKVQQRENPAERG